jgi:hypothetical protein
LSHDNGTTRLEARITTITATQRVSSQALSARGSSAVRKEKESRQNGSAGEEENTILAIKKNISQ